MTFPESWPESSLNAPALTCWLCGGKGYVPDGQAEDGMMTGRMQCPRCAGGGHVTPDDLEREVARMRAIAYGVR